MMPRFNARGDLTAGIAGGTVSVNGQAILAPAGGSQWLDDQTIVFGGADAGRWVVWSWSQATGLVRLDTRTPTELSAGGGCWAAFTAGTPAVVFGSIGDWPGAGLYGPIMSGTNNGAGADGTIAVKRSYQSDGPMVLFSPTNQPFEVPDSLIAYNVNVLGPRAAVWTRGNVGPVRVFGVPVPFMLSSKVYNLTYLRWGVVPWVVYVSDATGAVAHPANDPQGAYAIHPELTGKQYGLTAVVVGGRIKFAFSTTQGERPQDIVSGWVDECARYVAPSPEPVVDRIGAPCWLAWFTFGAPAVPPPGNAVIYVPDATIWARTGQPIATYAAGVNETSLDDLEVAITAAKTKGLPVLAYWPRQLQEAGPLPRGADWIGVEAYQRMGESLPVFEARVNYSLTRCPRPALICQAYTSNAALTTDLVSLVPVYARLAKARPGMPLVAFSAGPGRDTGLESHPEVRPWWKALADGIPGSPPIVVSPPPSTGARMDILDVVYPEAMHVGSLDRVLFTLKSDQRVTAVTVDLIGDGQEGWTVRGEDLRGIAGLWVRPQRPGRWNLRISVVDALGNTNQTGLARWVTVQP